MDNLIGQNPRDSLIIMRNQNLSFERERKIENLAASAKDRYSRILEKFSGQFLRSDAFHGLSELQKKELEKLCASFCRRRVFFNSLPFLGSFCGIFYLSFLHPLFLLFLIPWVIGSFAALAGMESYCEKKHKVFFFEQIDFLLARRRLKRASKLTPPNS